VYVFSIQTRAITDCNEYTVLLLTTLSQEIRVYEYIRILRKGA